VQTGPVEGVTLTELGEDWQRAGKPDVGQVAGGEGTGPAGAEPGSA
jgi:hypothetical protein